jgi:hypothetical protein
MKIPNVVAAYLLMFTVFVSVGTEFITSSTVSPRVGYQRGRRIVKIIIIIILMNLSSNTLTRIDRWNLMIKSIGNYNFEMI